MTELPGNRETAYRVFAAEFDDATVDYQESDEERAPNYVITPTGARANRLFVVGVLTEVEDVNDEVLRARIVDPTGAFVVYAGQYQPDEMAALERLEPPAFVAVTGKARTFSPDDSDRVFTSIRPESINTVDADTRDRWIVRTAEHTVSRVGIAAAAAGRPETGEELRAALEASDVSAPTASGVALALEHYGTTPAYLAGLHELAVDAVEVVAGEREEVEAYDGSPDSAGDGTHTYADLAADLDDAPPVDGQTPETGEAADTRTPTDDDAVPEPTDDTSAPSAGEAREGDETDDVGDAEVSEARADAAATDAEPDATESESEPADATEAESEPADATEAESEPADAIEAESEPADAESEPADAESEPADDVEMGDVDARDEAASDGSDATADAATDEGDDEAPGEGGVGDFEPGDLGSESDATSDQMYEFDEEERQEIEDEYGTEFSSGNDVPEPEESDLDAPEPEDLDAEPAADATDAEGESTDADAEAADAGTDADADDSAEADGDDDDAEPAGDVDLDAFVVDAMRDMDDGDGVARDDLVEHVTAETGADADAVDDAIQDALMGGQCYEPDDGVLKPI